MKQDQNDPVQQSEAATDSNQKNGKSGTAPGDFLFETGAGVTGPAGDINAVLEAGNSGNRGGNSNSNRHSTEEEKRKKEKKDSDISPVALLQLMGVLYETQREIEQLGKKIAGLKISLSDLLEELGLIDSQLERLETIRDTLPQNRYEQLRERYGDIPLREIEEEFLIRDDAGNAVYIQPKTGEDGEAYLYRLEENPETGALEKIRYDDTQAAAFLEKAAGPDTMMFANETMFFNRDPSNALAANWREINISLPAMFGGLNFKIGGPPAENGDHMIVVCDETSCRLVDKRTLTEKELKQVEAKLKEAETELHRAEQKAEDIREQLNSGETVALDNPEPGMDHNYSEEELSHMLAGGPLSREDLREYYDIAHHRIDEIANRLSDMAGRTTSFAKALDENNPKAGPALTGTFQLAAAEPTPEIEAPALKLADRAPELEETTARPVVSAPGAAA